MARKLSDSIFAKIYLILYNVAQLIGWGAILVEVIKHFSSGKINYAQLWANSRLYLSIFQTLQLIEVVHAAIKLVPSSPVTTFVQIISRIIVLWAILVPIKETTASVGVALILASWSIAESTRYLYYALNIVSLVPSLLTWCRYSFFILLYPSGVSGELILMWRALPYIKKRELLYYKLPNPLNISFYSDWVLMAIMFSYIPLFPQLYMYMLSQRRKVLGGTSKRKEKVK
ncbi:very-long-chain (3R)-3-hydroxyacyl-CoA dehydratase hpo-8-like [Brevipalpus obovatus]|uniref:very-long-chain (3R)-3-hydroxyacyl-CoA dehydratase hpo-8-like n=1 Tax=Brevipalpus obovatus TaxID=246614 RepID=UPI003D9F26EA